MKRSLFFVLLLLISSGFPVIAADVFQTPVKREMLDGARFAEWVDGAEQPIAQPRKIEDVLVTQQSVSGHGGLEFGQSKTLGLRHLRITLKERVPVGSLLVRGVGVPSVLKAGQPLDQAADLADESIWTPGRRILDRAAQSSEAGLTQDDYSLWVFPPDTKTSAIRFTHIPQPTDKSYAGWLNGIYVLEPRLVNVAPFGTAGASAEPQFASRIVNESIDGTWKTWANSEEGTERPITPDNAESVTVIWDEPVALRALCTLWTGFSGAEAAVYIGPVTKHPNESTDPADWKTVASLTKLKIGYGNMEPNWFDFGKTLTTRAVRLRITAPSTNTHPHIVGKIKDGKRVWLGELLCLAPLDDRQDDPAALLPKERKTEDQPPIPIRFTLPEDGLATLVIENEDGTRVRNLVSETPFKKGENTVYWDGSDDLLRDNEAAGHGLYNIPKRLVEPGKYTVRGLFRKPLSLHYEFSVYNEGTPPWTTADSTGGWLTNHTPPSCALWVPAEQSPTGEPLVYLGSYISEGGHGLAWFDVRENVPGKDKAGLTVTKKGGVGWVGGVWTGAQYLARDTGGKRNPNHGAYVASAWSVAYNHKNDANKNLEVRITAMLPKGGNAPIKYTFPWIEGHSDWEEYLGGFAVNDGVAVLSMRLQNRLVRIDTEKGDVLETIDFPTPGGSAYDADGHFYLLSGNNLYRWAKGTFPKSGENAKPWIADLDAPNSLTFDARGNLYISERGKSHHVRVFDKDGKALRTIGKTGTPAAGPYDELRMNNPAGMTIDDGNRLWVTENDFQPKRVSVWTADGKFLRAFYGPAEYGGGGTLDPEDPTRFFYYGMEFRLDWKTGSFKLVRVFFRPGTEGAVSFDGHHSEKLPETPLYPQGKSGPRYFTNAFNSNPTSGNGLSGIWYDDPRTGTARLVALCGTAHQWSIFKEERFRPRWPEGIDLNKDRWNNVCRVFWYDANGNAKVDPEETRFEVGESGGITAGVSEGRLHFIASRIGDRKQNTNDPIYSTVLFRAVSVKNGVPIFDFEKGQVLASGVGRPVTSGGDQSLFDAKNDRAVITLGVQPFARESLSGTRGGKAAWSYPSPWPGLHASHEAAVPSQPGQLIGTTRLLGDFIRCGVYPCPLFAVNGNMGNMYLMSSDGMFVATLFHDVRTAPLWSMPTAMRNMDVTGLTLHDENFWPSITQTRDGKVFLIDGANSAIVRVDGLDSLREIKPFPLTVCKADMEKASTWLVDTEQRRQKASGQPTLRIAMRKDADSVTVDGKLDDWAEAEWAVIDRRGVAANFNSSSKPYDISAGVCVAKDRLAVAFRTNLPDLLKNSGELPQALFKNGGCLDVMIGANPKADPNRRDPVEGDMRLLVTLVAGKPRAVLYRAVVPGAQEPVPFSSPSRTIMFDRVDDVSESVEFAAGEKNGVFEIAIPLGRLDLKPRPGMKIKADLGVLRGNGFATLARVYWSNKATAITADVPSEAQLTPSLWGNWVFE